MGVRPVGADEGMRGAVLAGRVALVTGGSRGIGRAACLALARQGAAVAVHWRAEEQQARRVVRAIEAEGGRAAAVQADLAEAAGCRRAVAEAEKRLGAVDILVNNAGEMTDCAVADLTEEVWNRSLAVNLTAAFLCAQACLPQMAARGWGRIINISSQAAEAGSARHAHYAAAKAGLLGFTYSLAKEMGPHGVTVNAVSPGRIETDMIGARAEGRREEWLRQTPLGRLGTAAEVAAAIVFLASPAAGYITGARLNVAGGLRMG